MNIYKRTALSVALAMTMTGAVCAQTYTLMGGAADGQYTSVICPAVAGAMKNKGFDVKCVAGPGAGGNFKQVAEGKVAGGFAQKDVLSFLMSDPEHPEYEWFLPLGNLAPEALWVVVRNPEHGGRLKSFSDLTESRDVSDLEKPITLGIAGGMDSGSFLTVTKVLADAIPDFKRNIETGAIKLKSLGNMSPSVAYNYLGNQLDGVVFVMMPDTQNSRLSFVEQSNGQFRFLDITDGRLMKRQLAGQSVYEEASISVADLSQQMNQRLSRAWASLRGKSSDAAGNSTVNTVLTQATLVVNPTAVDQKFINALSEVVSSPDLMPENSVAGQARKWWSNLKSAASALTQQ